MATIQELIELATNEDRDAQARECGFMIGISGRLYTLTFSKVSTVYLERIDDKWKAWRETHYPNQKKAISNHVIAIGNNYDYVLMRVKSYFAYIKNPQSNKDISY